jgi:TPR repeat protein
MHKDQLAMPIDALQLALQDIENENYTSAIASLTPLALEGNIEAMFRLGALGLDETVEITPVQAYDWLKKAADQGHAVACHKISSFAGHDNFESPLTSSERLTYLQKSAELGNADAQYELAESFCTGEWLDGRETVDQTKSFTLYKKAAEQGHPEAQYELGWAYLKREGTTVDKAAAEVLFTKSADQGNPGARRALDDLLSGKLVAD